MQRLVSICRGIVAAALAGLAAGCGGGPPAPPAVAQKPFAGAELTVACANPEFAKDLSGSAAGWAGQAGARVRVEARQVGEVPGADVAVVRPTEVGGPASRGELAPLPPALMTGTDPLQWPRIAEVYRNTLSSWGGERVGLPLAGDAYVLAYRADLFANPWHQDGFRAAHRRDLAPPGTWEDALEVAAYFVAAEKRPSLPPVPPDPVRLLTEFHQVAACYDRRADTGFEPKGGPVERPGDPLAFHVRTDTWKPRLGAPSFAAAADWFHQSAQYRMPAANPPTDPVAALDTGAVLAVLSLADVGRLPRDEAGMVAARFGIAPLPGTRTYFTPDGKRVPASGGGNYVPFFGSGGWIGVVSKGAKNRDAAWAILARLAAPDLGLARLSAPAVGAGPVRPEHASASLTQAWLGYRFDPERTTRLAEAVAHFGGLGTIRNPAIALRTPDQAARTAALEAAVRKAATGQASGADAVQEAAAAWEAMDAAAKPDELTRWRRNAVGLP